MAKTAKRTKVLAEIYRSLLRDKIRTKNQLLIGPTKTMGLQFTSKGDHAYTTLIGKTGSKLMVVIGGELVARIAKLPTEFTNRKMLEASFNDIVAAFYALDYHEMGHVLFTDMRDTTIKNYPESKYRGFLAQLTNIIEDPVIECCMANLFATDPKWAYDINPQDFFDFLIERMFHPEDYKDDGTINGFMNYLLLLLRCGKTAIKGDCKVFDKYSVDLLPLIKDAFYEPDATERIHKCVKLGEWIIENIKEFSWELPEPPEEFPSLPEGFSGSSPRPSTATPEDSKFGEGEKRGKGGKGESESEDGAEEGTEGEEIEDKEIEEDAEGEEGDAPKVEESLDDIDEEIEDIFNDMIHDGDDHEWVIAKDEFEIQDDSIVDTLDEIADKYAGAIVDVSKFLTLFKGRNKPREQSGFTFGKLNVFRAMQDEIRDGCETKLFNQKVMGGKDKDLAVSLLCDNSGSMTGRKSIICSEAAIVLAQACDRAKIPFECNCFTKTEDSMYGTCITIVEKSFDDTFENAKPYFAINDSFLIRKLRPLRNIPTFYGNSEEVNLYYIWKNFARVNHKTKLLFVLCDGETTGSVEDLKTVVRQIEAEDGIIVIGIGVCCYRVAEIYPHHKIFSSNEELETGLAQYLIDTISKYAV